MPDHAAGVPAGSPAMDVDLPARYPTVVPILHRRGRSRARGQLCGVVWRDGDVVLSKFFRRGQRDEKLEQGLEKTRRGVFRQVIEIFQRGEIDEDFYDDLEAVLIGADIGVETTELLM